MLRLNSALPNMKLEMVLAGAPATVQPSFVASWSDVSVRGASGGANPGVAAGTTPVTLVLPPAIGYLRDIDYISIVNRDSAAVIVTIQYKDGSTAFPILTVSLDVGSQLCYTSSNGWQVIGLDGSIKTGSMGATGATGPAGADGAAGPTGPAGADGADGSSKTYLTTVATTSGSTHDFTIPTGVRAFKASFTDLSSNGSGTVDFLLGDSGGIETTGYACLVFSMFAGTPSVTSTYTTKIPFGYIGSSSAGRSGHVDFTLVDPSSNMWEYTGIISDTGTGGFIVVAGNKALSAELTTLRLSSADTFDGGKISVSYESAP